MSLPIGLQRFLDEWGELESWLLIAKSENRIGFKNQSAAPAITFKSNEEADEVMDQLIAYATRHPSFFAIEDSILFQVVMSTFAPLKVTRDREEVRCYVYNTLMTKDKYRDVTKATDAQRKFVEIAVKAQQRQQVLFDRQKIKA